MSLTFLIFLGHSIGVAMLKSLILLSLQVDSSSWETQHGNMVIELLN